jgi:hypothetical protein
MSTITLPRRRKAAYKPEFVMPASVYSATPMPGHTLVDLRSLGIIPGIAGGAPSGYNQASDIVTQTVDGFDLNDLWTEYQTAMSLVNAERQTMVDFLTFTVSNPQERVPQISSGDFERSSEYGEPRGIRPTVTQFTMGYDFEWYDVASRFTWRFLADAPRSQVDAINAMVIEGDNRNVFTRVMSALFTPTNRLADINGQQDVSVYALYNGDGTVPPKYKSYTHDGTHTHYLTSGAATVNSLDLDDMEEHLRHHGYSSTQGMRIVLLVNSRESKVIRSFRTTTGAAWDFIPATNSPALILPADQQIIGQRVAPTLNGLNVVGTYGNVIVVEEDLIPPAYMAMVATGGRANLNNPVGVREHQNTTLRGLRLVKGPNADYPLIDSFYQRGIGTGVRHRGGSVVMQVSANASYTAPAEYNTQV